MLNVYKSSADKKTKPIDHIDKAVFDDELLIQDWGDADYIDFGECLRDAYDLKMAVL